MIQSLSSSSIQIRQEINLKFFLKKSINYLNLAKRVLSLFETLIGHFKGPGRLLKLLRNFPLRRRRREQFGRFFRVFIGSFIGELGQEFPYRTLVLIEQVFGAT